MEKPGRREEVQHKCSWTWPVSNRRSCDRCGVFTKQTNKARWRAKTTNRGWPTCEKKPGSQAGISFKGFEGISERWEDCVPHQDRKSVLQNLSYVTRPKHPKQLWSLAGAARGHRHRWAVFKPLTFPITFHFRAAGERSHVTISENEALGTVELHMETSDMTCDLTSNKSTCPPTGFTWAC